MRAFGYGLDFNDSIGKVAQVNNRMVMGVQSRDGGRQCIKVLSREVIEWGPSG